MNQIRSLFDPTKGIQRSIEKVISYQASREENLKSEIAEYIVTDSIEYQLERLLETIQAAMETGGGHEIGVWVSGFYGSGKSSFTKYLGLAFDQSVVVDGQPFLQHLHDRLNKAQTKALLKAVTTRFPAAIVMLDLATEQIAGAALAEVSEVLYHKVLRYAGFSRNIKVAALEKKLKKENRFSEFEDLIEKETGSPWADIQDDELIVDSILPRVAHRIYPELFATEQSFTTTSSEVIYSKKDRVQEMVEIVREYSGKEHVIFVIDEVGQYVGGYQQKILDLQGLAENLKNLGQGKVWIIGTAQQTLTEDDQRSAINSPELFKLKDRFPITVELESSDIREICYRRLLAKSATGQTELGTLFDSHGQALRHNTKLTDAKYYDAGLDRETFIKLYPFLPAHFDILLHLLAALAKSTGGIGLRSAIKIIQEILVENYAGNPPFADQEIGKLATTVTLYDSLEKEIRRAFSTLHQAVEKALIRFADDPFIQDVAKSVAVLQMLGNIPVTVENLASLMHPAIDSESLSEPVRNAVEAMIKDSAVPLGEKDGSLRFLSDKLNDVEREKGQLALHTSDLQRIQNESLREVFDPLPTARLNESLTVTSGLRRLIGGHPVPFAGDRETVQMHVVFTDPSDYEDQRAKFEEESRHKSSQNVIYLIGRTAEEAQDLTEQIYRCRRIIEQYQHDPDQEVKDYCRSQDEQAKRRATELKNQLARALSQGSFVFHGSSRAVDSLDANLSNACKKQLSEAAEQIYSRSQEAPVRASTDLAEKFLRQANADLRSVTKQHDPLELVVISGSTPNIDTGHKALRSIHDFVDHQGSIPGKPLLDAFNASPFGWSPDTSRYLVAALLVAGEIKLRVSGHDITVNGQQAIDALKTNAAFKSVGVSLRDDRPSNEVLAKAAERLTDLAGETIVPLEDDISKAVQKLLPGLQQKLAPLVEILRRLDLPGVEKIESVSEQLTSLALSDASDAPKQFGAEESLLYEGLKWAIAVRHAFDHGLDDNIRNLRGLNQSIMGLPETGIPGTLRKDLKPNLDMVDGYLSQENFFDHNADLNTALTGLNQRIAESVTDMMKHQSESLKKAELEFEQMPEWSALTAEEQNNCLAELQKHVVSVDQNLEGLLKLIARQFDIDGTISDQKTHIRGTAELRRKTSTSGGNAVKETNQRTLKISARITDISQLDAIIQQLQNLKTEGSFTELHIVIDEN